MKRIISLVAALALTGGAVFAQAPQREEIANQIDQYVQQVIATWKIPGAAVAFSLDNEPLLIK